MSDIQIVWEKFNVLEKQHKWEECQKLLETALIRYPDDINLITEYISACYTLNDYPPVEPWIHRLRDLMGGKLTPYHHSMMRHYIRRFADWTWYEAELKWLKNHLDSGYVMPFYLFGWPLTLSEHKKALRTYYARKKLDNVPKQCFDFSNRSFQNRPIKIGFVSPNWHNHPEITQTPSFYRFLNSDRFQVYFYDLSPLNPKDLPYKNKIVQISRQTFKNVSPMNDTQLANLIFFDQIDILVDLAGLSTGSRLKTFIQHPAPIQLSWLAYPETMGGLAGFDYLIADSFVIPPDKKDEYNEKVIYLEPSYQVYDENGLTEKFDVTRAELNLPENAFVFGCVGQDYKITPEYFQMWMRILKRVPNSVLWLHAVNPKLSENLRREAEKNGVDANRLVFFSRIDHQKYMWALKCVDLMLDTQYVNAHTTTSDSTFMGVPVLTCPGQRWVSRVCGSILNAMEMPELITQNEAEYEEKAVFYATHPTQYNQVKEKLAKNIKTTDFFNSKKYAEKFGQICMDLVKNYQK